MVNRIFIILSFIFVTNAHISAENLYVSCKDVERIEVIKMPQGMPLHIDGIIGGSYKGEDCFMLGLHLTGGGALDLQSQLHDIVGKPSNIYVGEKLVISEVIFDSVTPVEFLSPVGDRFAFATYKEAAARASAICDKTPVKYTDSDSWLREKSSEKKQKQGLGDKEISAQYDLTARGISIKSREVKSDMMSYGFINGEALVYIKNIDLTNFATPVTVRAGSVYEDAQEQTHLILAGRTHIFRFTSRVGQWHIAIGASSDMYMLVYEVWNRKSDAK